MRLPIYRHATADLSPSPTIEDSYRDYPCPECGDVIPLERLATVEFHSMVDARIDDPEFIKHARVNAAHRLIAALLEKKFITFQNGAPISRELKRPLIATVGVVSPTHVASLQERVAKHQEEFAREVVAEAVKEILNWGSYFTGKEGTIQKGHAAEVVRSALTYVLTKRSQTEAA